jgi:hypothetical protein
MPQNLLGYFWDIPGTARSQVIRFKYHGPSVGEVEGWLEVYTYMVEN